MVFHFQTMQFLSMGLSRQSPNSLGNLALKIFQDIFISVVIFKISFQCLSLIHFKFVEILTDWVMGFITSQPHTFFFTWVPFTHPKRSNLAKFFIFLWGWRCGQTKNWRVHWMLFPCFCFTIWLSCYHIDHITVILDLPTCSHLRF